MKNKYYLAVKIGNDVEIFEFDSRKDRDRAIEEISEKLPNAEYATSQD